MFQVRLLSVGGGSNTAEATRRAMRKLMTSDLAQQFNFMGRGGAKRAFSTTHLKTVISGLSNTMHLAFVLCIDKCNTDVEKGHTGELLTEVCNKLSMLTVCCSCVSEHVRRY